MPILDSALRQASSRRALLIGQYWRPEVAATKAIGGRPEGLEDQKTRSERRLGRD